MKSQPIKLGVYKVICLAVKHHGHGPAAQTTIMQSLHLNEHLPGLGSGAIDFCDFGNAVIAIFVDDHRFHFAHLL